MRIHPALVTCFVAAISISRLARAQDPITPPTVEPAPAPPSAAAEPAFPPPSAAPAPDAAPAPVVELQPEPASPPEADGEPVLHASNRPGFALLVGAGLHTGLALGARFGLHDVGVEVSGGYQLLLSVQDYGSADQEIDVGSSGQLNAELFWTPWHPLESSAIGLKAGYRYNTVLTHGFSVAINFLVDLNEHLAFEVLAGSSIFPGQRDRLNRELGVPGGSGITYDSTYQLFEYGFELIWYP